MEKKEKNWMVRPISASTLPKPQPVVKKTDALLKEASKKMGKTPEPLSDEKKPKDEALSNKPKSEKIEEDPIAQENKSQEYSKVFC